MKEDKYDVYIEKWLKDEVSGNYNNTRNSIHRYIKQYLFEKNKNKCQMCGWSEINKTSNKIPLHVHHIDGDSGNTTPDNLQLLCPNCHSLTENHGSLNMGKSKRIFD